MKQLGDGGTFDRLDAELRVVLREGAPAGVAALAPRFTRRLVGPFGYEYAALWLGGKGGLALAASSPEAPAALRFSPPAPLDTPTHVALDEPLPPPFAILLEHASGLGLGSALLVPLGGAGAEAAMLVVAPPRRKKRELDFVHTLAFELALALHAARVHDDAALTLERARREHDETRNRLATLERVVRHAPVGIGYVNRELRYELMNEVGAAINGHTVDEHVGHHISEILPPDALPVVTALMNHVLDSNEPFLAKEFEIEAEGKPRYFDGGYFPVDDGTGRAAGVTALMVDQTEHVLARKQIEALAAAERERTAELRALLEASPNGILLYGRNGRARFANARVAKWLGIPAAELVGEDAARLVERFAAAGAASPDELAARLGELFSGAAQRGEGELHLAPRSLTLRYATVPVAGEDGTPIGRLFVFSDVSRERELEERRTQFMTVAAHELRTPLTPLAISIHTIGRRIAKGEAIDAAFTARVERHLARLSTLIEELLAFSALESGRMELAQNAVSLAELVVDVVETFRATAADRTVELRDPEEPLDVVGDAMRLEQVVVNLLQNAVKYGRPGGRVAVTLGAREREVFVEVEDDGIGIPEEERARLFQRYFRASNAVEERINGLGIGLYVSHEIVRRHGGRFEVDSKLGEGSTFRFFLPRAAHPA